MVLVFFIAMYIKANIPISIGLVWITNPFTMPVIFYIEYYIGPIILNETIIYYNTFSIDWISNNIYTIAFSLYTGAIIIAITTSILISYSYVFYVKLIKS